MREHERPQNVRRIDAVESQIARGIPGALVVIAANQNDVDGFVCASPLGKRCEHRLGPARLGVKKIAEKKDSRCSRSGNESIEPANCIGRSSRWNWNAAGSERRSFPPVRICDQ
jgi:hypothetical protein